MYKWVLAVIGAWLWFRSTGKSKQVSGTSRSGDDPAVVGTGERSDPERPSKAEMEHDEAFAEAYALFWRRVVRTLILSVLLTVLAEILLNLQPILQWRWRSIDLPPAIGGAEALAMSLGLATVVAALSIALVTQHSSADRRSPSDFASESVWADQTAFASTMAAVLALVTGFMQAFGSRTEHQLVTAGFVLLLAGLAMWLSAAVTTWHGRETLSSWTTRRDLAFVESAIRKVEGRSPDFSVTDGKTAYARFVFGTSGVTTVVVVVTIHVLQMQWEQLLTWRVLVGSAGLMAFASGGIWGNVAVTIAYWKAQFEPARVERWSRLLYRGAYLIVVTLIHIQVGVRLSSLEGWITTGVLWLGIAVVPVLFLSTARRRHRGPAVFAVYNQLRAGEARRRLLQKTLIETP